MALMRRFSQRNPLVTLDNINITPLLDLAFVLLIIFVIATQSLEQGMELTLPAGGAPDQGALKKEDIQTVEIGPSGQYMLNGRRITLPAMETALVNAFQNDPNSVVYIRTDEDTPFKHVFAVTDLCRRNNITRMNWRSVPQEEP